MTNNIEIKYKSKSKVNLFFEVWDYEGEKIHALKVNRGTKNIGYVWSVNLENGRYMGAFIDISTEEQQEMINYLKSNLDNYGDKF